MLGGQIEYHEEPIEYHEAGQIQYEEAPVGETYEYQDQDGNVYKTETGAYVQGLGFRTFIDPPNGSMDRHESFKNHALSACRCVTIIFQRPNVHPLSHWERWSMISNFCKPKKAEYQEYDEQGNPIRQYQEVEYENGQYQEQEIHQEGEIQGEVHAEVYDQQQYEHYEERQEVHHDQVEYQEEYQEQLQIDERDQVQERGENSVLTS